VKHFEDLKTKVLQDVPLAMYTWFQLGGPARYFAEPEDLDALVALLVRCRDEGIPVRVLGRGSNLLIRDEGVAGLVLRLSAEAFRGIRVDGNGITAGGGARLGRVVTTSVHEGLAGLEELVGIPGTLGGAIHGNAGAQGSSIGQWITKLVTVSDQGEISERGQDELTFDYRESGLEDVIITRAVLELEEDDPKLLSKRMQKHWIVRKSRQPLAASSAGCVFRNPRGLSAGELIEQSGLKNARIGGASVSDRHANFVIAEPEATSQDVLRLIDLVRDQVVKRTGVELELEIEIW
jgi:UDP-N-acetylmuramate dehydrogenase